LKHTIGDIPRVVDRVAPRAGAWVETVPPGRPQHLLTSHPVRVRGLKLRSRGGISSPTRSHPVRVRGLKHYVLLRQNLRYRGRTPCGCVG